VGNQRLAAGKAWFRMTSRGGKKFVQGAPALYGNLFVFDDHDRVVLRPGVSVPQALAAIRVGRVRKLSTVNVFPDEVEDVECREGATIQRLVNAYERDPRARNKCLEKYGTTCCVCGFSFGATYGKGAEGIIHVHHLRPLSTLTKEYVVDPIADLRPVCPNCHAVIHSRKPVYTIDDVRSLIGKTKH